MMRKPVFYWLILAPLLMGSGCTAPEKSPGKNTSERMRAFFEKKMVAKWYPASLDLRNGGFLSNLEYDWGPSDAQDKMVVTQARHLWTLSKLAALYPDSSQYRAYADHGYRFLRDVMWDSLTGGFRNLVSRDGQPLDSDDYYRAKRTYGNAFGLYALAAYAKLTGSDEALDLAKRAFRVLERDAFDPQDGGYFQFLNPGGRAVQDPYKDQNTTIHLLEAYAEFYRIWPNDTLRGKLQNLVSLVRDTMVTEKGYLILFFHPGWHPVSYRDSTERNYDLDHVSFGHDIETAFLILDALEALGEAPDEHTLAITRKMVAHSLEFGIDQGVGGLYERGYYEGENLVIIDSGKNWWSQAEGLNSLLVFDALYPKQGYREEFQKLWEYVDTYFLDHEFGGWYERGLDVNPESKTARKAHIWKGPYHTFRSMMHCLEYLEGDEAR